MTGGAYDHNSDRGASAATCFPPIAAGLVLVAIVMVLWSWDFMIASWAIHETSPGVAALPVYPIKTLFFAGNLLLLIQGVAAFLRVLAGGFSRLKGV